MLKTTLTISLNTEDRQSLKMDKEGPIFVLSTYIITASIITYHCYKEAFKLKKNKLESKVTKLKILKIQ